MPTRSVRALTVAFAAVPSLAAQDAPPVAAARAWRASHEAPILAEFKELLAIPNLGRDLPNIRKNAAWIQRALAAREIESQLLTVPRAPAVVFAEIETPGASRTVVYYAHYDGQPVAPDLWATEGPYVPALYSRAIDDGGERIAFPATGERVDPEARLYARSSGDDKAPVIALLAALDALRAAKIPLRTNVKLFFEGEEELGSMHVGQILEKYRDRLDADVWVFCDGPVHQNRQQQVVFGVRGVTGFDVTVYGPRRDLHSGHYGNWAPNPAMMLARLLATMKDEDGNVLVDGFYDDVAPLGDAERRALAAAPDFDDALARELWLGHTEGGRSLAAAINRPSLNVRGLQSAGVGGLGRNVVPATATASIDIRLVKGMDPKAAVDKVVAHIERQGFHVVSDEPGPDVRRSHPRVARVVRRRGYAAVRAPMDSAPARAVLRAVRSARGDVVVLPTLGGSLPLADFERVLGAPVLIVPIANHDDNQHAPDENLRIQNLWDGIETMAALLAMDW